MGGDRAQVALSSAKIEELRKELAKFGLEFLAEDLARIKDINKMVNGPYGQLVLCSLSFHTKDMKTWWHMFVESAEIFETMNTDEIKKLAVAAFSNFGEFRADFLSKYNELEEKNSEFNKSGRSKLQNACYAFLYAREKNNIVLIVGVSDAAKCLRDKIFDCDVQSYLLMTLGREVGLDLIAATEVRHVLVANRENGKVTVLIEPGDQNFYVGKDVKRRAAAEHFLALQKKRNQAADHHFEVMRNIASTFMRMGVDLSFLSEHAYVREEDDDFSRKIRGMFQDEIVRYGDQMVGYVNQIAKEARGLVKDGILGYGLTIRASANEKFEYDEIGGSWMREAWGAARAAVLVREYNAMSKSVIVDRSAYRETSEKLRDLWEQNQKNVYVFKRYFNFLKSASGYLPLAHVDNEREVFALYNEGVGIFGKKKLEENELGIPIWKKLANPYDWYKSKKE